MIFCIHIYEINAEHSVEDWLDLASDARLFKSIKIGEYSPQKTCLPLFLPNQTFWVSYTVSIPKPDFLSDWLFIGSLYQLISEELYTEAFCFKILGIIAKIIVEHSAEIKGRDLHPKQIYVERVCHKMFITFTGKFSAESAFSEVAENSKMAFVYLMFYLLFPELGPQFDRKQIITTPECLYAFYPKIKKFVPAQKYLEMEQLNGKYPKVVYWEKQRILCPLEICALNLFYEKITMEDIIVYLDTWDVFNDLYYNLSNSVNRRRWIARCDAREDLDKIDTRKYSGLLALIKKVSPDLYGLANLLYWLEPNSIGDESLEPKLMENPIEYEVEFKKLFDSEEQAEKQFVKAVDTLFEMLEDKKIKVIKESEEMLLVLHAWVEGKSVTLYDESLRH